MRDVPRPPTTIVAKMSRRAHRRFFRCRLLLSLAMLPWVASLVPWRPPGRRLQRCEEIGCEEYQYRQRQEERSMGADTNLTNEIDAIVHARIDPRGPGAAVVVIRDGAVIHAKGYGLANLEWERPIDSDTVFWIGSTTKPFTATAIVLLAAEGRLRLEDSIRHYLPELPATYDPITIHQLLTHTSGAPNHVTRPGFWERVAPRDHSPEELMALFTDLPLDFAPGTEYSYSNAGYTLLGVLIERLSGMSYAEFIRARVFEPMGMRDSRYMSDESVIPRRATGYAQTPQGYRHVPHFSATVPYAAGALGSTLGDLVRWERAMREHSLLDAATQERMQTPVRLANGQTRGYGLGWGRSTYRGRRVVHHAGGVPGFSAFFGRFVEDGLSVIVLSNLAGFDAGGLSARISNRVLGLPEPARTPVSFDARALDRVVGAYGNFIGETLDVRRENDALVVSGDLTHHFLPSSATTFYAAGDPDMTLRFEDAAGEAFARVTAVVPFYWFTVTRMERAMP